MGTGLRGFLLSEVELLRAESGAPYLHLSGRAAVLAADWTFSVSVTHTAGLAAAVVVGEQKEGERHSGTDLLGDGGIGRTRTPERKQ